MQTDFQKIAWDVGPCIGLSILFNHFGLYILTVVIAVFTITRIYQCGDQYGKQARWQEISFSRLEHSKEIHSAIVKACVLTQQGSVIKVNGDDGISRILFIKNKKTEIMAGRHYKMWIEKKGQDFICLRAKEELV